MRVKRDLVLLSRVIAARTGVYDIRVAQIALARYNNKPIIEQVVNRIRHLLLFGSGIG